MHLFWNYKETPQHWEKSSFVVLTGINSLGNSLFSFKYEVQFSNIFRCPSRWPRRLRRRFAAARLLRMWVRNPPGTRLSVSCECCVAGQWSLPRANHLSRGVLASVLCLSVIAEPQKWSPDPLGLSSHVKKIYFPCMFNASCRHNYWVYVMWVST